jgi:hypothetical protein
LLGGVWLKRPSVAIIPRNSSVMRPNTGRQSQQEKRTGDARDTSIHWTQPVLMTWMRQGHRFST